MPLTQQECAAAIADHSRGFAEAAAGNLDAEVEFCPGWTVRDVVHHLTRVQWFWATLVEDGPDRATRRPRGAGAGGRRDDAGDLPCRGRAARSGAR